MAELIINSRFNTDATVRRIQWFTVVWMIIEVAVALLTAIQAHSVALAAFGGGQRNRIVVGWYRSVKIRHYTLAAKFALAHHGTWRSRKATWHHSSGRMGNSRSIAIVAVFLMLGFMLPTLCFALVATDITTAKATMPSGCHGQQNPMPMPSHSCCYASNQVPQAVQFAPSPVPQNYFVAVVDVAAARESYTSADVAREVLDSSPPPTVLRI
jgi:hypothetical protein